MRTTTPMPGNLWPHDMVISVDDGPYSSAAMHDRLHGTAPHAAPARAAPVAVAAGRLNLTESGLR